LKQTRVMSMVEAATNVVVGYLLAIATQIVVFPWFGIETGFAEHLTIGLAFVGVSLAPAASLVRGDPGSERRVRHRRPECGAAAHGHWLTDLRVPEGLAQLRDEAPWHAGLVGMLVLAERGICRQLQRDPEDAVLRVRAVGGAQRPAPSGMSQMR